MSCYAKDKKYCAKVSRRTPRCIKNTEKCDVEINYTAVNSQGTSLEQTIIEDVSLDQLLDSYTLTEVLSTIHGSTSTVVFGYGKTDQDTFAIKAHLLFDLDSVLQKIALTNDCLHNFEIERAKAIVEAQNLNIEQLKHEALMYQEMAAITKGLPNLVRWVKTLHISRNSLPLCLTQTNNPVWKKFIKKLTFQPNTEFWTGIGMIITERRPKAISLQQFCKDNEVLLNDSNNNLLCSLTFQILITLAGLQQFGFQHNDLHASNILVDMDPTPSLIKYSFNDIVYNIPVKQGMILIFDWDLGTTTTKDARNQHLINAKTCEEMGVCEEQNPYFDMFRILKQLSQMIKKNREWQAFYEQTIGGSYSDVRMKLLKSTPQMTEYMDNLCGYDLTFATMRKQPLHFTEPQFMETPAEALKNTYFDKFLTKSDFSPKTSFPQASYDDYY